MKRPLRAALLVLGIIAPLQQRGRRNAPPDAGDALVLRRVDRHHPRFLAHVVVLEQPEQLFVGDGDIVEAEPAVLVAVDVLQVVVHVADGADPADERAKDPRERERHHVRQHQTNDPQRRRVVLQAASGQVVVQQVADLIGRPLNPVHGLCAPRLNRLRRC